MAKILMVLTVVCTAYLASADELATGEVTIRLYAGTTTNYYTDYPIESGEGAVNNPAWDSNKPVVIYIHGLAGNVGDQSTLTIATAYLGIGTHNVLAINYAKRAMLSSSIVANVGLVGVALGQLINRLVGAGVKLSSIHLIGFGLGPHVAAHAARTVSGRLFRITALDPALPAFYRPGVVHIESTDATIVDVIHTDAGILGVANAIGTVDFYPNSGRALQPGCKLGHSLTEITCSTNRAWQYYAESVKNAEAFKAIKCNSWDEFTKGIYPGQIDYLGYGFSLSNTGTFCLQTKSEAPYCKGDNGIVYVASESSMLSDTVLATLRAVVSRFFG